MKTEDNSASEFETVKDVPLDWVLKKHGLDQLFEDTANVCKEAPKTKFNGHYYALTDISDWFDMRNSILSVGGVKRKAIFTAIFGANVQQSL